MSLTLNGCWFHNGQHSDVMNDQKPKKNEIKEEKYYGISVVLMHFYFQIDSRCLTWSSICMREI